MTNTTNKIELADIKKDVGKNVFLAEKMQNNNFLTIKTANDWIEEAKLLPIPRMLFSEFWHENEICILFADSNAGKSILAMQIADSITKGIAVSGFKFGAKTQKVLYFDFEMSPKQLEARYSIEYKKHYIFSDNFFRASINVDGYLPDGVKLEEYIKQSLELLVVDLDVKIIIIDNITYLNQDNEKARDALPLMKRLKELKSKYKLSILVLAHTPKRDLSRPITINDVQGSKMLINFADSAFTIGKSTKGKLVRYIKQIKERNTEQFYGADNVITCKTFKENNFLEFVFLDYDEEREHLRTLTDNELSQIDTQIIDLSKENPKMSNRQIAKQLDINHTKVNRVLKKYGTVEQMERV